MIAEGQRPGLKGWILLGLHWVLTGSGGGAAAGYLLGITREDSPWLAWWVLIWSMGMAAALGLYMIRRRMEGWLGRWQEQDEPRLVVSVGVGFLFGLMLWTALVAIISSVRLALWGAFFGALFGAVASVVAAVLVMATVAVLYLRTHPSTRE